AHGSAPRPSDGHAKPGQHSGPSSFPAPEEDLAALDLDATQWEVELCEKRSRTVMMPDREPFVTHDSVVLVRRR
ncbi:MAG: SAM-dependent methyltransferase, partial [Salinibacterium amurskyense]